MNNLDYLAYKLGSAKKTSNGYDCRCPLHEDKKASLSIKEESGKLLVYCHAGCSGKDIIQTIKTQGLWGKEIPFKDLSNIKAFLQKLEQPEEETPPKVTAIYDYKDRDGSLLKQVLRYHPKTFKQRAANGSWSVKDIKNTPYRLPELVEAVAAGKPVLIVEGEKDVETAMAYGFAATCNSGGAGKWQDSFKEYFHGAHIILVPDNDEPGVKHQKQVLASLETVVSSARWLYLPKHMKDLSDSPSPMPQEEFERIVKSASQIVLPEKPAKTDEKVVYWVESALSLVKPIKWQIEGYLEQDAISEIYGPPGSGKSFVAISMAASVATGRSWYGNDVEQGLVLYVAGEGHNGIIRRLAAWEIENETKLTRGQFLKTHKAIPLMNEAKAEELVSHVMELASEFGKTPRLVVIDTLARCFGDGDENATKDMNKFVSHLDTYLRKPFGCNVLLVHHSGHTEGRARGSSVLKGAVDAEFQVTQEEGMIRLKSTKMKDAEFPPDLAFRFKKVTLAELDGEEIASVVLKQELSELETVLVKENAAFQPVLARDLIKEILTYGWNSQDQIASVLKIPKGSVQRVLKKAAMIGVIEKDGTKAYKVTEKARMAYSHTGAKIVEEHLKEQRPPVWQRRFDPTEH